MPRNLAPAPFWLRDRYIFYRQKAAQTLASISGLPYFFASNVLSAGMAYPP